MGFKRFIRSALNLGTLGVVSEGPFSGREAQAPGGASPIPGIYPTTQVFRDDVLESEESTEVTPEGKTIKRLKTIESPAAKKARLDFESIMEGINKELLVAPEAYIQARKERTALSQAKFEEDYNPFAERQLADFTTQLTAGGLRGSPYSIELAGELAKEQGKTRANFLRDLQLSEEASEDRRLQSLYNRANYARSGVAGLDVPRFSASETARNIGQFESDLAFRRESYQQALQEQERGRQQQKKQNKQLMALMGLQVGLGAFGAGGALAPGGGLASIFGQG